MKSRPDPRFFERKAREQDLRTKLAIALDHLRAIEDRQGCIAYHEKRLATMREHINEALRGSPF